MTWAREDRERMTTRNRRRRSMAGLTALALTLPALPAIVATGPLGATEARVVARGAGLPAGWQPSPLPAEVLERARDRQQQLKARGLLGPAQPVTEPPFVWPVRQADGWDHERAWATVSFVDHDERAPGFLLDYHGGQRTYDTAFGYNHQGSDALTWPFGWTKTLLGQVEVVAAAAGRIVDKVDGFFDQECGAAFEEERTANLVAVAHDDGSIALYGHLKRGSLTGKAVGERVEQGEYLGVVGSSGHSSYPHLHFEVYDESMALVDPFAGPFNDMNSDSWWGRQPAYYEPGLFAVMTHSAPPMPVACNHAERTHIAHRFTPGDDAFFAVYFRDRRAGHRLQYRVLDPRGRVFAKGRDRAADEHWAISWLTIRAALPGDALPGTWTFQATARGRTLEKSFEVGRFEPERGVDRVRPRQLRAGTRRRVKITGFGFTPDLVADVHQPEAVERRIVVERAKIRPRQITLTVRVPADADSGPRRIVLTAPDYTQVMIEPAFRVRE